MTRQDRQAWDFSAFAHQDSMVVYLEGDDIFACFWV